MSDNEFRDSCQINDAERRLNSINETLKNFGARIGEVETRTIIYNEQIKTISNALQEIKQGLKEMQQSIDDLERRPADLSGKIIVGVVTSIITGLLMLGLKLLN